MAASVIEICNLGITRLGEPISMDGCSAFDTGLTK
jgi:hypothetical protein